MTLQSMTGFARSEGVSGRYRWAWELRSVNGKGLDIRLRLPSGMEVLEADIRDMVGKVVNRGNIQIGLNLSALENRVETVINRDTLQAVVNLRGELGNILDPAPLRLDTLLAIRGLVEFREAVDDEEALAARHIALRQGLAQALSSLKSMREREGAALGTILSGHIDMISALTGRVESDPSRRPEEICRRMTQQISLLTGSSGAGLDSDRLYAEAALIATRADLREEIDRLKAHVSASRELLQEGGPIGRKLDFLAQEFNRESNTICSKSNAAAVTAAGIELKVVIDQFREQVQNLE